MSELSKEVVALLQYLMPGFLVAWVYFGLTLHVKPQQFERVVQALIFTLVVQVFVTLEEWLFISIGEMTITFGQWTDNSALFASLITAVAVGIVLSVAVHKDIFYTIGRRIGITNRTAHPSEWAGVFHNRKNYIILHMKDDLRLYGWPHVWPSDSKTGHFFVTSPSWQYSDGESQALDSTEGILVDTSQIKWIEFIKPPEIENVNETTPCT